MSSSDNHIIARAGESVPQWSVMVRGCAIDETKQPFSDGWLTFRIMTCHGNQCVTFTSVPVIGAMAKALRTTMKTPDGAG